MPYHAENSRPFYERRVFFRLEDVRSHYAGRSPKIFRTHARMAAGAADQWPFQRTLVNNSNAARGTANLVKQDVDSLGIIFAEFPSGVSPVLTLTSRIATKIIPLICHPAARRRKRVARSWPIFCGQQNCCPPTALSKRRPLKLRAGKTDVEKARAIYEWIVDSTFRNPKTRGCGTGDIRFMLESGDLGGKCADLNALYVGLARAAGLPARDVYGIRIANRISDTRVSERHQKT